MHFYIYDHFLNNKKYLAELNRIESRLTDLGIIGRIEKLTILKSFSETVKEIIKRGATTIVAVGNDETVSKIISLLPSLNITLGIIPIGPDNKISEILGIPTGEAACDTLSARIIEKIDLGKANNNYFISNLQLPPEKDIVLDCGKYNISPLTDTSSINICNFNISKKKSYSNPRDGILEAIISDTEKPKSIFSVFKKEYTQESVFPFKKIKIKCSKESLPVIADGHTTIKTPISVEVAPKKLKVIVGKNRMF